MQAFYSRQYATFFDTQHTLDTGSRFTAAIQNGGTFMKIKNVAIKNFAQTLCHSVYGPDMAVG